MEVIVTKLKNKCYEVNGIKLRANDAKHALIRYINQTMGGARIVF